MADEFENCQENASKIGDSYALNVGCLAEESTRLSSSLEHLFSERLSEIKKFNDPSVSPELKKQVSREFKQAQKYWHSYIETQCRFEADLILGTGRPLAYTTCLVERTKRRIEEIKDAGF